MTNSDKIIIYMTDSLGDEEKVTISYVNPTATDADLKSLGVALTQLTSNTFNSVSRIFERDITNANAE